MKSAGDTVEVALLNQIQTEVPVAEHPFAELGRKIGATEEQVIQRLESLKSAGIIRQISAIFDTRSLGYASSLVGARVDPARVDEAAAVISQHPGVSHNYLRNHTFNLWYTIAVSPLSKLGLEKTVEILHRESGAESTRLLPTLKLYKIGVKFDVGGDESRPDDQDAPPYTETNRAADTALTPAEIEFVRVMQRDLLLKPTPFVDYARELGISFAELQAMHRRFLDTGKMRRFAAVLHHRQAGFKANAMGVWAVPGADAEVDRVGETMAGFRVVSHCYKRPIYPDWPYNIFTMVHGKTREACEQTLRAIAEKTGIRDRSALYSAKEYKKVRVRYFTTEEETWERQH
ncbi:MAG TPA: Lrp/AsnC family transcriptional regulator [Verrucomicrobiae bacterium]|nr:Lrp/AsnC family transcriptional regulator [Verrucomicrobiae bacterium]